MINGVYGEKLLEYPTPGTNHSYSVRNITDSNDWRWYVDGVAQLTRSLGGYKKGWSETSSERNHSDETNYSHFWNLRKRNSSGTWYYWTSQFTVLDSDPDYYRRKVSETNLYVEKSSSSALEE